MPKEILKPLYSKLGLSNDEVEALYADNVPEELTSKIGSLMNSLTTIDAAKANQDVRNHVMASTLDGVESAIFGYTERELKDLIDENALTEAKKEGNTSRRVIKLIEQLRNAYSEQIKAKAQGQGQKASDEAMKRITELENALKAEKSKIGEWENKYNEREKQFHQTRVKGELQRHMAGLNWKDKTPEMIDLFTNTVISKASQSAGFKFDDNGNLIVHNRDDASLGVYGEDQTKPLSTKEFVLSLAKPFVAKNDAPTVTQTQGGQTRIIDTSAMSPNARKAFELRQEKLKNLQSQ